MTSTVEPPTRVHPITRFASRAHEVLDEVMKAPAWSMSVEEQRAAVVELDALESRVAALKGEVLLAGDRAGIGEVDASPSTAVWYARAADRPGAWRRGR